MANNLISVQLALLGSIIIIILPEYSSVLVFVFFSPNYIQEKEYNFKKEKKEGENCFFFRQYFSPFTITNKMCGATLGPL